MDRQDIMATPQRNKAIDLQLSKSHGLRSQACGSLIQLQGTPWSFFRVALLEFKNQDLFPGHLEAEL